MLTHWYSSIRQVPAPSLAKRAPGEGGKMEGSFVTTPRGSASVEELIWIMLYWWRLLDCIVWRRVQTVNIESLLKRNPWMVVLTAVISAWCPHVRTPPPTVGHALADRPSPWLSPIFSLLAENKANHLERERVAKSVKVSISYGQFLSSSYEQSSMFLSYLRHETMRAPGLNTQCASSISAVSGHGNARDNGLLFVRQLGLGWPSLQRTWPLPSRRRCLRWRCLRVPRVPTPAERRRVRWLVQLQPSQVDVGHLRLRRDVVRNPVSMFEIDITIF
jgi:hypothetical protein